MNTSQDIPFEKGFLFFLSFAGWVFGYRQIIGAQESGVFWLVGTILLSSASLYLSSAIDKEKQSKSALTIMTIGCSLFVIIISLLVLGSFLWLRYSGVFDGVFV